MIKLEKVCGLPISLDENNHLKFAYPLKEVKPAVRTFDEMKPVFMDQSAEKPFDDMYYMYRDLAFPEHRKLIEDAKVSYDVTIIPAGKVGNEFNKTVGHYHANQPGTHFAYPEVYEVIHGHALFLLQKMDDEFKNLITVIAMEAKAGDKVVYPPNYGHIIVNIGDETLVTANWVGRDFERIYKPVSEAHGLAYYVTADPAKGYKFELNPNYTHTPEVRVIDNKFMNRFPITGKGSMYDLGTTHPDSLEFLIKPDKYAVELSSITS